MILALWNKESLHDAGVVSRIAWLAEHAEVEFEKRGLSFPYQVNKDGGRRRLTAVDLEHSLCYFSRYLAAHDKLGEEGAEIAYVRRADIPWETGRGDAACATWIFRGDESRRRRGRDVDLPWRRVEATPRPRREQSVEASRGDAAAAT